MCLSDVLVLLLSPLFVLCTVLVSVCVFVMCVCVFLICILFLFDVFCLMCICLGMDSTIVFGLRSRSIFKKLTFNSCDCCFCC